MVFLGLTLIFLFCNTCIAIADCCFLISMASAISDEEDNFLRFHKLLGGPGTDAVRLLFDSFFPINTLDIVLQREQKNIRRRAQHWRITKTQLDLIFPSVGKNKQYALYTRKVFFPLVYSLTKIKIKKGSKVFVLIFMTKKEV